MRSPEEQSNPGIVEDNSGDIARPAAADASTESATVVGAGRGADSRFEAFLQTQIKEGTELASESDILELTVQDPQHFIVRLHCRGLIRVNGNVQEANLFMAGIYFPPTYLDEPVDPGLLITWFGPINVWHPNISHFGPGICIGPVAPCTGLKDLIYRIYDVVRYEKYTPNEYNSLNKAACAWARNNAGLFPTDSRPLKRRKLDIEVEPL